jgi:hypothetical protein
MGIDRRSSGRRLARRSLGGLVADPGGGVRVPGSLRRAEARARCAEMLRDPAAEDDPAGVEVRPRRLRRGARSGRRTRRARGRRPSCRTRFRRGRRPAGRHRECQRGARSRAVASRGAQAVPALPGGIGATLAVGVHFRPHGWTWHDEPSRPLAPSDPRPAFDTMPNQAFRAACARRRAGCRVGEALARGRRARGGSTVWDGGGGGGSPRGAALRSLRQLIPDSRM